MLNVRTVYRMRCDKCGRTPSDSQMRILVEPAHAPRRRLV